MVHKFLGVQKTLELALQSDSDESLIENESDAEDIIGVCHHQAVMWRIGMQIPHIEWISLMKRLVTWMH